MYELGIELMKMVLALYSMITPLVVSLIFLISRLIYKIDYGKDAAANLKMPKMLVGMSAIHIVAIISSVLITVGYSIYVSILLDLALIAAILWLWRLDSKYWRIKKDNSELVHKTMVVLMFTYSVYIVSCLTFLYCRVYY